MFAYIDYEVSAAHTPVVKQIMRNDQYQRKYS